MLVASALCAVAAGCGGTSGSSGPVPRDFVGLSTSGVLAEQGAARDRDLRSIAATGAGIVRQRFDWALVERRPGHFDLSMYDGIVSATSRAGLDLLPILFLPPRFRASGSPKSNPNTVFPPRRDADMGRFAAVLERRYGPRGTLWSEHPSLPRHPIRAWQVWNEPNLPVYWGGRPDASAYVRMLRAVGGALKRVDAGAQVVTAGLPDSRLGVPLLRYLKQMYEAGARGALDVVAIHPYAVDAEGALAGVQSARGVLERSGDGGVPIWITEIGWASGGPPSAFTVGPDGQAKRVTKMLTELASRRRELGVRGVFYFTWQDVSAPPAQDFFGLHTGLRGADGRRKPAYEAWVKTVKSITS